MVKKIIVGLVCIALLPPILIALWYLYYYTIMATEKIGDWYYDAPSPPTYTEFNLSEKGSKAEIVFRIKKSSRVYFKQIFVTNESIMCEVWDDQCRINNKNEKLWLSKFSGWIGNNGTPTPLRLTVYKLESDKKWILILNYTLSPYDCIASGSMMIDDKLMNTDIRYFENMELKRGIYKAEVENLQNFPELKNEKVFFSVGYGLKR